MAQEIIDIGSAPNDGLGDPLRTAFAKTNNNFTQLFATAGITGIANGSSNVNIPLSNGNVVISSAGTANVLTVTGTGVDISGTLNLSGLATLSNLSVTGTTISTGTIQSLTDVTAIDLSASANITAAGYLFGDGGYISNITAVSNLAVTMIANGTTVLTTTGSGANVALTVGGVSNVVVFATSGEYVNGVLSASGNVTGGNILTGGLISAAGNITSGNLQGNTLVVNYIQSDTSTYVIVQDGLSIHGDIDTIGDVFATGEVYAGGNITGAYFIGNGSQLTGLPASYANADVAAYLASGSDSSNIITTANISGGNLLTTGLISATSTITGSSLLGTVVSVSANITGGNLQTGGLISATSTITSAANITGGNILTGGLISATSTITGTSHLGAVVSVTANVTGGNILTGGLISATSTITGTSHLGAVVSVTANVTGGNILTGGLISASGNIAGDNLSVGTGTVTVGNIVNSNGNAVGNIGSSSTYFNQVFAQATTALYADLAEIYSADAEYAPGTVVSFGGNQEVTKSTVPGDPKVAGVISENPSYLMNSGLQAQHRAVVALTGRVPTQVQGPVTKGDMMISAGDGRAQACATPAMGTVIGKALNNFDGNLGTIEIVVGRM